MLSEQNQKILQDQFNSLPVEIQDTILKSNWKESIRRVTEKYALHVDQGGALETIVFLTMLGIEEPTDFVKNLKEEVRVTESLAQAITKEVEENVFQKIRHAVMQRQSLEEAGSADDLEIIDEDGGPKDKYREVPTAQSKYVDGQHLDEESILSEIEDPKSIADAEHSDIEIPKEVYDAKKVDIVEADQASKEATDPEKNAALKSVLEQSGQTTETRKDTNPLHIRTLKSDIMRQKLENPSWTPELEKGFSKNTQNIVQQASKEASTAPTSTPGQSRAPTQDTAPTPAPSNPGAPDPYREQF